MSFSVPEAGPTPEQDPNDIALRAPAGMVLEAFLGQDGIALFPTEFANIVDENPWKFEIGSFLGRALDTPPTEGRPQGKG